MDEGGAPVASVPTLARAWRPRPGAAWLVLACPLVFLAAFLVYPLEGILRESLFGGGRGLEDLQPLVEDTFFLERAWFTVWQAAVSTVLTLGLALPCAYVLARYDFPLKSLAVAVATVPFVLPTVVVAVAFTALIGPQGALNDFLRWLLHLETPPIRLMNTIWLILIAHVFYNVAMAARIIAAYWANLDESMGEAAAMLGAGRFERFARVTLPLLRPPLLAAGSLVFLFCFTSFGVILILGGPHYGTIETEIYRETLFLFRLPVAGALALLQVAFTFAVITVYTGFQRSTPGAGFRGPRARPWRRGDRLAVAAAVSLLLLVTVAPLAALVERSLHGPGGYTLAYYRALDDNVRGQVLFVTPLHAVWNSVRFALMALALALPLGTLAAYGSAMVRRRVLLEALFMVPLGVSAVTLGLGFIITFDEPPLDLRGSVALLVIAHTLIAFPFVARAVSAQLRGMDPRLREAARMLGAGPARVFLAVDLPIIWRSIAVGAVFAFATSMGEFGATLLISRPEWATVPVSIFRYLGQPGALNYGQALAMATILMGVSAAGFLVLERLRFRALGAF